MKHTPLILSLCVFVWNAIPQGNAASPLKWRVQQLHKDNNEGLAVGDINGDGKLDVTSGEFWYQAPNFKQRKLREILPFGADYMQNNSEHLMDVDGNGWKDVIVPGKSGTHILWNEGK